MPTYPWQAFLAQWSRELLATGVAAIFPAEAIASGWIGAPGATPAAVARLEARLERALPPSYRQFLQVSDGWPMVAPLLGRLWSAAEVDWLALRRSGLIEGWLLGEDLFGPAPPGPDDEEDPVLLRPDALRTALEISDLDARDGAIYLLNPLVVGPDGEWEAWYLASWLPGAERYPSFWEMMEVAYDRFVESRESLAAATPEFVDYARQRLFARPDARRTAARLPDLIEALDGAAERGLARPASGQPPTLPGYQQTMAEGIAYAAARVREVHAAALEPQEVVVQLKALAGELQHLARTATRATMKDLDLGQVLRAGLMAQLTGSVDGLDALYGPSGRSAGYMTAADLIESFLDER
jgi:hypothetical protein